MPRVYERSIRLALMHINAEAKRLSSVLDPGGCKTGNEAMMGNLTDATRMRIFIGNDDTYDDRPLYDAMLAAARDAHITGVTVLRGIAGYGRFALVHDVYRGFSRDLPVVVEIVDTPARIDAWLPALQSLLTGGLVTIENVRILEGGSVPIDKPTAGKA
jgi:uncharacterized protein